MDRRDFLKTAGVAGLGAATLGMSGCISTEREAEDNGPGKMASNMDGVSLLGFGCMRWPTVEKEDGSIEIDQEKVNAMVDRAIEAGVNYFDSAPVYIQGKSEAAAATALLRHPRESYYIATKCSNHRGTEFPFSQGEQMYKRSMEIYQTDHIDYYLLHCLMGWDNFKQRFLDNGLLDYFLKEREEGRIKKLGWSYHGDKEGFDAILATHEKYHWDFVQIQMNYVDWRHPNEEVEAEHMYHELDKRGIPVVIMEPLLGGNLSEVPSAITDLLMKAEPSKSIASWAFRFCGSFPRVLTTLSGMSCMEHLEENIETFCHFKPLDEEEFTLLERAAKMLKEFPRIRCTGCQYCMPCPYGIDIPGIFGFYNTNLNEGTYAVSSDQKYYQILRRRYLFKYDKSIPTVRQADHCIGCGKCLEKCPQHINIPSEMVRINEYVEKLKQETTF